MITRGGESQFPARSWGACAARCRRFGAAAQRRLFEGRRDHPALAVEPFTLEHPVHLDGEPGLLQQGEEISLVDRSAEIDRGQILELGLDEVHEAGPLPEDGLGEDQLPAGLEPVSGTLQDGPLVPQQHETQAE